MPSLNRVLFKQYIYLIFVHCRIFCLSSLVMFSKLYFFLVFNNKAFVTQGCKCVIIVYFVHLTSFVMPWNSLFPFQLFLFSTTIAYYVLCSYFSSFVVVLHVVVLLFEFCQNLFWIISIFAKFWAMFFFASQCFYSYFLVATIVWWKPSTFHISQLVFPTLELFN